MKILVIQQKMIGDVLTSSILFEALRKKYPEAQLHYLVYPHTTQVLENTPFIDQVLTYKPEEDAKPDSFLKFLKLIKKAKYDVVIDVYSKIATGFMSKTSGAPIRISYHKWYTAHFYTRTIQRLQKPRTNAGLAIENRMLLLKALDKDFPEEIKPKIYLTEEERTKAKNKLNKAGISQNKALLMIGVLGSSEDKTYPLKYMAVLLDEIANKSTADILFNYIPNQKADVEKLYNLCSQNTKERIHLEIYGKNLREFLALTAQCDALIGNEGGAINMAKAIGVPTFAIFSPQIDKEAWAIYEDKQNKSVHLKDFKPELFNEKKADSRLYKSFTPDLIFPELQSFLKKIELT